MSRPSGPVVVFHAHCASATVTVALPGQALGTTAVSGRTPVPDAASGWQSSVTGGLSAGFVRGDAHGVAFDDPKVFPATDTNAPLPSGQRANEPAPKLLPSSAPAS